MNDYSVSIVIPTYNTWDLTYRLLVELSQHEGGRIYEVIVVDDGSTRLPSSMLYAFGGEIPPFTVYRERLEENVGFTLACNHGLKLATKELAAKHLIFLISNDVQIKGKFIEQAADILFGARRAFVGNRHINFNSGWNGFDNVVYDYLEGWFLAGTSDAWRDLGYFDEDFAPADFEDIAISTVAKRKGYKLVSLNNPNIIHDGAGTYGYTEERRKITERNREIFRKKYTRLQNGN